MQLCLTCRCSKQSVWKKRLFEQGPCPKTLPLRTQALFKKRRYLKTAPTWRQSLFKHSSPLSKTFSDSYVEKKPVWKQPKLQNNLLSNSSTYNRYVRKYWAKMKIKFISFTSILPMLGEFANLYILILCIKELTEVLAAVQHAILTVINTFLKFCKQFSFQHLLAWALIFSLNEFRKSVDMYIYIIHVFL